MTQEEALISSKKLVIQPFRNFENHYRHVGGKHFISSNDPQV